MKNGYWDGKTVEGTTGIKGNLGNKGKDRKIKREEKRLEPLIQK